MEFLSNYGLIILLVVLLGFMFWSSRRRTQKQKIEQEKKARETVPGAEVLMQGGLYGTIVSFDPDNLDRPAVVEIAPGVEIKVHSQAILRVVDPAEGIIRRDSFNYDLVTRFQSISYHIGGFQVSGQYIDFGRVYFVFIIYSVDEMFSL